MLTTVVVICFCWTLHVRRVNNQQQIAVQAQFGDLVLHLISTKWWMFRRCNCSLFKGDVMRGAAKFKQNCLVFVKNYAASETELSSVWWSEVRGFAERNERKRWLTPPGQWFSKWGTWNPRGAWCYCRNIFLGFFFLFNKDLCSVGITVF